MAFGLSFVVACLLVPLLGRLFARIGIVDEPDPRKPHVGEIPLSGGVAVVLGAALAGAWVFGFNLSFFDQHPMLLWGTLIIGLIGLMDDYWDLRASIRLVVQLGVALGVVYWDGLVIRHLGMPFGEGLGLIGLGVFAEPITALAIVMMINAVNMLDGLDGLLGGVLLIAFLNLLYLGVVDGMDPFIATSLGMISAALMGFLVWNYRGFNGHQARYFLGDFGSMTLGYLLAYLAITTAMDPHLDLKTLVPPIAVAWVVALPAAEIITMVFKRMARKGNPMSADQTHLHHLLMRGGFSPWETVALIHGLMFTLAIVGILCWRTGVSEWVQYLMLTAFFLGYALLSCNARRVAHFLRGQPKSERQPEA